VTTRIEVFGNSGSAVIEDDRLTYLHLARDDKQEVGAYGGGAKKTDAQKSAEAAAQNPAALLRETHALQIADMIRAIRENGTPLVDDSAGRHPVEIILGIYESMRTHKEVTL
jgi:UDP-N-acetyl-2-amino-2-deoxyglucuronate dehydrogenase